MSVQLWEPGFGPVGTPGTVLFDELHATVGPDGEYYVLDDFEDRMKWLPMPTSVVSTDFLTLTGEEPFRDQLSASFTFGKETNRGIRGFSHISAGGLVPIVASTGFSRMTGYDVGDIAVLEIMEHLVPVVVRGKVELFPTMLPGGLGFVVADLDSLLRHLNIVNSIQTVIPNEVLIDEAPGASGTVRDSLLTRAVGRARVHDRETALESVRLNPLVTAGWRAMVVLSTGIILFTAAFGYLTYMLSFADPEPRRDGLPAVPGALAAPACRSPCPRTWGYLGNGLGTGELGWAGDEQAYGLGRGRDGHRRSGATAILTDN